MEHQGLSGFFGKPDCKSEQVYLQWYQPSKLCSCIVQANFTDGFGGWLVSQGPEASLCVVVQFFSRCWMKPNGDVLSIRWQRRWFHVRPLRWKAEAWYALLYLHQVLLDDIFWNPKPRVRPSHDVKMEVTINTQSR